VISDHIARLARWIEDGDERRVSLSLTKGLWICRLHDASLDGGGVLGASDYSPEIAVERALHVRPPAFVFCEFEDCDREPTSSGLCEGHEQQDAEERAEREARSA
jgi:hypothetical protein